MICISCKEENHTTPCQDVVRIALGVAVDKGKIPVHVAIRTAEHMAVTMEPEYYRQARTLSRGADA